MPRRIRLLARVAVWMVALAGGLSAGAWLAGAGVGATWFEAQPQPDQTERVVALPTASMPPSSPRTCSIAEAAGAPQALEMHGLVENADTGEVLFDHAAERATPTASVMKLITATTAMHVLGPDTRFETRVFPGETPGSYVLVGGGDPTLRSGGPSVYPSAASLDDLADQLHAHDPNVQTIGVDESLFAGDQWHPSWRESDRDDVIGAISALMVDAGRADAASLYSPRSMHPAQDAQTAFAARVGANVAGAMRPKPGSEPVARVQSPPVRVLVHELLLHSDNVIGEVLARQVAIKLGTGHDFASIDAAQRQALADLDIPIEGFHAADGSGLSRENRATAHTVMGVIEHIQANEKGLGELEQFLPRNGQPGTLDHRLESLPQGAIAAKTGWTDEVFGLAGFMTLADGSRLRFVVFVAVPTGSGEATTRANRDALDAIIANVYACGGQLNGQGPAG